MSTIISVSIPDKLSKQLNEYAQIQERSKSFMVKKALEQYLNQIAEDIEDYHDAAKAYDDFVKSGRQTVSLEEVAKKSDLLD